MGLLNQIAPRKRQGQDAKDAAAQARAQVRREARMMQAEAQRQQDMFDKQERIRLAFTPDRGDEQLREEQLGGGVL